VGLLALRVSQDGLLGRDRVDRVVSWVILGLQVLQGCEGIWVDRETSGRRGREGTLVLQVGLVPRVWRAFLGMLVVGVRLVARVSTALLVPSELLLA